MSRTVRLRRTVREFSSADIPDEVLALAIEAASLAPSGANMQPWKFVVIRDPAVKREIRIAAENEEHENYHGRMTEEWLRALAPLQTDWHKEFLEVAPALIVVFKEDYGIDADGRHVTHYYVNESVGIACGVLLGALNAAGLATLTHTPSPMGRSAAAKSLISHDRNRGSRGARRRAVQSSPALMRGVHGIEQDRGREGGRYKRAL